MRSHPSKHELSAADVRRKRQRQAQGTPRITRMHPVSRVDYSEVYLYFSVVRFENFEFLPRSPR